MVLIKVREGASQAGTEAMLEAFNSLPQQMDSSVIVQLTAGENALSRRPAHVSLYKLLPYKARLLPEEIQFFLDFYLGLDQVPTFLTSTTVTHTPFLCGCHQVRLSVNQLIIFLEPKWPCLHKVCKQFCFIK